MPFVRPSLCPPFCFPLLLGAALLVLVPHFAHLPAWISGLCTVTLLWRAVVTFEGRRMPRAQLLLPISIGAMAGVFASFNTLLGRDAGVAMLVLLVAFKMLEMHARRDLYVVIFLCFFLVLTNFFYSQSIGTAILMLASILALLCTQLSFQFTGAVPGLRVRLRLAASMLAIAVPLAALLFVAFPRIQGPLWGMPGDAGGKSGLSNSMAPGSVASLAMSDEPAFRVRFLDPAPPQAQLYWRGVVLGDFDGRTWTQVRRYRHEIIPQLSIAYRGKPVRHEVTLEPSSNHWLFTLDIPSRLPEVDGNPGSVSPELEISAEQPLTQRVRYSATSFTDYALGATDTLVDAERWLELPTGFNPQALQAGGRLRQLPDPADRVLAVVRTFSAGGYVYTLEPPLLGKHSIDEFLYRTRAGFCEHYAGAFVFLMRAAGVPARVVTGYQGGELNPVDGYLAVRQSDAHAWAEVWLAGRGWMRIDPTAAVSPDRVLKSAARMPRPAPFGLTRLGGLIDLGSDGTGLVAQLRYRLGALNNGWNQWVLNYTPERQRGLLEAAGGTLLRWQSAAGALALLALLFGLGFVRRRRQHDPVDALYSALSAQLGRLKLARRPDEGPQAYAARLSSTPLPASTKSAIVRFLQLYSSYKYAPPAPSKRRAATVRQLKQLLNEIR
ncbi:MAG: DUF3488 and DUF4129 domain-containing transglutaminase family protein [Gammaproteobacteria bacterium]